MASLDKKYLLEIYFRSMDYFIQLFEIIIWPVIFIIIFYSLRNEIANLLNRINDVR